MGTEPTTLNLQPSDLLKGNLQPFEVNKPLQKRKVRKNRSEKLSISEYQQLVVHLHKTIEKTERQRVVLEQENQQLVRRCRIQRRLITYLRGAASTNASQLSECEGQLQLARNQPVTRTQRVVSLNGALQKISGVELTEQTIERSELVAAIDPQDLQSIDELEPMASWQRLPQSIIGSVTASGKSVLAIAESVGDRIASGVETLRSRPVSERGSGWYQHAREFVQSRAKST